jgi:hypothetical protein
MGAGMICSPVRWADVSAAEFMNFRSLIPLLVAAVVLHLSGCIPATATLVPQVSGRVVSAHGVPIHGATVRVSPEDEALAERSFAVKTDRRGRFRRAEQTRWSLTPFLPIDAIAPTFVATASHENVQSAPAHFGGGLTHPHFLGIGNKSKSFDLGDLVVYESP